MDIRILVILIPIFNLLISKPFIKLLNNFGFFKKTDIPDKNVIKKRNKLYYQHLNDNISTPSSYGILFIINVIIFFLYLFLSGDSFINDTGNLLLLGSILILGLLGFVDDLFEFFLYKKLKRWGIRARYKFLVQTIVFFSLFYFSTNNTIIAIIGSLGSTFLLNSYNITDGLDGLIGGISLIIIPILYIFEYNYYENVIYQYLLILTFFFLLVFMIFNINPAKVFLGDSGSYALGVIFAYSFWRYPTYLILPLYFIILIEGTSSLLQITWIKLLKKKMFKIAPLHLDLVNHGIKKKIVVRYAWLIQFFISSLVLTVFLVWL